MPTRCSIRACKLLVGHSPGPRQARLSRSWRQIATEANKLDKLVPIQRLVLRQNPSPQGYREMAQLLDNLRRYDEAAATLEEMMTKYPDEKNPGCSHSWASFAGSPTRTTGRSRRSARR